MKKNLLTAVLYTMITAIVLGVVYPLVITGIAKIAFSDKAEGQLIRAHGVIVGSRIIGQAFSGPSYFHSRPSAAGTGYDASASSGSNLGPTSKSLVSRVDASARAERNGGDVPIDLVTTSASGLDPDISPAAAFYQVPRVSAERHIPEEKVHSLVMSHVEPRQFGLLGEPRVNVLELNLSLDHLADSK